MRVVQETCEWVDVCAASPATSNDLVVLYGYIVFGVVKCGIRLDNERERKLALFEKGVGRGHGIKRGADIFGRAVCVGRRCDGALFGLLVLHREYNSGSILTLGGRMIGGGGWSRSLTWNGWPCMLMSVGINGFSLWAGCGTCCGCCDGCWPMPICANCWVTPCTPCWAMPGAGC